MNENIKSKIKTKKILHKQYAQNGWFESDFVFLETFVSELNELIFPTKTLYYKCFRKKWNNSNCKQKRIDQFLNPFITTKKFR